MTLEGKLGLLGTGPEAETRALLRYGGHGRLTKVRETWSSAQGTFGLSAGPGCTVGGTLIVDEGVGHAVR